MAVSESPLSLPSGKSCNSAEMHIGSSTEFLDTDFCDGMLLRDRRLTPDCDRGIGPPVPALAVPLADPVPPSDRSSGSTCDFLGRIWASLRHLYKARHYGIYVLKFENIDSLVIVKGHLNRMDD